MIFVVITGTPKIINLLYKGQLSADAWLGFLGSYLGAIIGFGGAMLILGIQMRNEKRRGDEQRARDNENITKQLDLQGKVQLQSLKNEFKIKEISTILEKVSDLIPPVTIIANLIENEANDFTIFENVIPNEMAKVDEYSNEYFRILGKSAWTLSGMRDADTLTELEESIIKIKGNTFTNEYIDFVKMVKDNISIGRITVHNGRIQGFTINYIKDNFERKLNLIHSKYRKLYTDLYALRDALIAEQIKIFEA